jgi:hypothetical protein
MRAIERRVRRLEFRPKPMLNEHGQSLAEVIRERRRKRCEAEGTPYVEPPPVDLTGCRSIADVIWRARRQYQDATLAATSSGGSRP